ncbi:MAG: hypothetical protein RL009_746 [Actinomycetota bacterium]|jgi:hypothetical protein
MKRTEQLSLLTPEQLREYRKFVWRAVGCGIGLLWTFPLFSWPTIYPILYEIYGHDGKLTGLAMVFGSFIPLIIVAAIFANLSKYFQRKARNIRLAVIDSHLAGKEPNA